MGETRGYQLTPLLNFYSQADPYKLRHVDDYSLKLNYARTTKFKNRRRRGACDYCLEGQSMKRRIVVNVQLCG